MNPDSDRDIDIAQVIKDRLTKIDTRLTELTDERARINEEIRSLREERVPLQRLARAAEPKPSKSTPAKPSLQGTVDPPTPPRELPT